MGDVRADFARAALREKRHIKESSTGFVTVRIFNITDEGLYPVDAFSQNLADFLQLRGEDFPDSVKSDILALTPGEQVEYEDNGRVYRISLAESRRPAKKALREGKEAVDLLADLAGRIDDLRVEVDNLQGRGDIAYGISGDLSAAINHLDAAYTVLDKAWYAQREFDNEFGA